MKLFMNDCSINNQGADKQDAIYLLSEFVKTFTEAKKIAYEKKGFISPGLVDKFIYSNISIKDFLNAHLDDSNPVERKLRVFFLSVFYNKPRQDALGYHAKAEDKVVDNELETCLKGTCFDDAVSSLSGALVVSLNNSGRYANAHVKVKSSIYGERKVLNVNNINELELLMWKYEHNIKHARRARRLNGVVISAMDLNEEQSRTALSNGVLINKRVYSKYSGKWYAFHAHRDGIFHGYSFSPVVGNKEHQYAQEILERLEYLPHGQIFMDCL